MSVLKTFDIALDTKKALYGSRITLVESDTGNRFVITLTDDGTAVDLTGCRVSVVFSGAMGTAMQESWTGTGDVSISGTSNNIITIDVHSGSFATGLNTCEIQVYSGATYTTLITSARFTFNAQKPILDDETIVSTDSYPTLVYWADKLEALTEREQADWTEADNTKGTYIQNKPVAGTGFQDATQNLIEETSILTTDIAPMYRPTGTAHHFKATVASWIVAIRTAIFGTTSGMLKANGSGVISAAVANTDYAAAAHASRHATGGADAITPGDIGAAALAHASRHLIGGADALNAMPYDATSTNLVIDGNFNVNQRAKSGTVTLAAGVYGHDRWKAGASGCTYTFATSANVTTLTISAGSLVQVIEGANLQSGTVCLSWTGTAQGKIGAGSYSASGVTGTATGGTNLNIEFNAGTLSKVQLNYGSVALPLVPRSFADELRLCQRYYTPGVGSQCCGYAAVTTMSILIPTTVQMRTNPSVTATILDNVIIGTTVISVSGVSSAAVINNGVSIILTLGTSVAAPASGTTANTSLTLDAEL